MRWTEATCSLAALVVCRLSDALAAASKSGFALAQPATDEMWKHVAHGDLVFAHPALDLSQPLDNAIIAVGAATTDWLRQTEHRIIVGNETATHVGIAVRSLDYSLYILVIRGHPAKRPPHACPRVCREPEKLESIRAALSGHCRRKGCARRFLRRLQPR